MLIAALTLVACGSDDEPAPKQPDSGPLVTYERSGGIAGVVERLRIDGDGQAMLERGIEGAASSFQVPASELETLESELEAAEFDEVERAPDDMVCADCFIYGIEYGGHQTTLGDLDQPPPSVAAVLVHLGELAADHQPPDAPGS